MTAVPRRAYLKKSNKSRAGKRGEHDERGNEDGDSDGNDASALFDITRTHPIVPPRTSSLARDTGFEADFYAAVNMSGGADSYVDSGVAVPAPSTPVAPIPDHDTGGKTPPHTPRGATNSAGLIATPSICTTTATSMPAVWNTISPSDTHASSTLVPAANTPTVLVTANHGDNDPHSLNSSQVSLAVSHSSVSRSPAAQRSSLATSWTNEGNADELSVAGNVSEQVKEDTDDGIVRADGVIDLVGGEGVESVGGGEEDAGRCTRDRSSLRSEGREIEIEEHGNSVGKAEQGQEKCVEPPKDSVREVDIVDGWHPLSSDLLSTDKVTVAAGIDPDHAHEDAQEQMGPRRTSVQFSEDCSSDTDEKRKSVRQQRSSLKLSPSEKLEQLKLKLKSPPSPQPWEIINPPEDNNARSPVGNKDPKTGDREKESEGLEQVGSDHYSTLNSKNFATMQKSRRRPLIPHSSYYFGPPPPDTAYGTPPVGHIGVHHPREIVRIERDYATGEVVQFSPVYPLELESRITPTQFHETINDINEILISAYSVRHAFAYNFLAVVTLQLSTLVSTSHYTKNVAFLFLEIEYYVRFIVHVLMQGSILTMMGCMQ
ncbi:hypothetical protein ID866_5651 [Astraeus odoratus]|nr:hypothetical protein ID866_5651 [Astraeus odoratus]